VRVFKINHICGCRQDHKVYKWTSISHLESQICFECKCKAENEIAAAATSTMPALEGSEKQVAWATAIRFSAVERIDAAIVEMENRRGNIEKFLLWSDVEAAIVEVRAEELANTSAKWWIENRDVSKRLSNVEFAKAVLEPLLAREREKADQAA